MKLFQPSSMIFKSFVFQILCVICCLLAVSSYSIDNRPPFEDRDERAVTEWRFRRNYLFKFPNFYRTHFKTGRGYKHQGNGNNQIDDNKVASKKFIIPSLVHP